MVPNDVDRLRKPLGQLRTGLFIDEFAGGVLSSGRGNHTQFARAALEHASGWTQGHAGT